jgi:hypothetical protein
LWAHPQHGASHHGAFHNAPLFATDLTGHHSALGNAPLYATDFTGSLVLADHSAFHTASSGALIGVSLLNGSGGQALLGEMGSHNAAPMLANSGSHLALMSEAAAMGHKPG